MITKTALIPFIMMFSPAASSLATRVGGGVGPFPEKYRYWYWASLPGGRSQPWLTCAAAAGVFHLNVYDLVVLANTDFWIFASPSPGGRVTLNDVVTWRCDGVMWSCSVPCNWFIVTIIWLIIQDADRWRWSGPAPPGWCFTVSVLHIQYILCNQHQITKSYL